MKKEIIKKIISSKFLVKKLNEKISSNLAALTANSYKLLESKEDLSLVPIDHSDYDQFIDELKDFVIPIGNEILQDYVI